MFQTRRSDCTLTLHSYQLESKPGKGDDLQRYLMNIHAFSNSPEEPGCLTFRVTRAKLEGTDQDKFVIFEEYVSCPGVISEAS